MQTFRPAQLLLSLVAGGAVSACVPTHAEFKPTERVQGYTIEGFKEAFYDLSTAGVANSEVKVWSSGADAIRIAGGSHTAVRVGLTIDNGGREPIEVVSDHLRLESLQTGAATRRNLPVYSGSVTRPCSPGRAARRSRRFSSRAGSRRGTCRRSA